MNVLRQFGNIPVTAATVGSVYPSLSERNKKVGWLEKHGEIIRLKRGLYVVNPEISGKPLSTELIANHIYAPSYVSMSSALRYYGLIPEIVYDTQSMTVKHARTFDTPYGRFSYKTITRDTFHIGVRSIDKGDYAFMIATPEKALCDLIANTPHVCFRYLEEARIYLEDDIRIDMDGFARMDASVFEEYVLADGKKGNSVKTILKLLQNEQRSL